MFRARLHRALTGIFWIAILNVVTAAAPAATAKRIPPNIMLWSWYAEDDFRAFSNKPVGVAYLALSIELAGKNGVHPSPRAAYVRIPPAMYKMAVIRIDGPFDGSQKPAYSVRQRELAARMVAEIVDLAKPQAVQIDFDAPKSAWPFYRQLLSDIRARIGQDIFLSITALVSWCSSATSPLSGLPVDEIVPMAFYMGQITDATVTLLKRGGQFAFPGCRTSIGVDLPARYDGIPGAQIEPLASPRTGQRAYFFISNRSWSPLLLTAAQKRVLP
jgi:hypothetical protein